MLGVSPSSWKTQSTFSPTAPSTTSVMSMLERSSSYTPSFLRALILATTHLRAHARAQQRNSGTPSREFRIGIGSSPFRSHGTPAEHAEHRCSNPRHALQSSWLRFSRVLVRRGLPVYPFTTFFSICPCNPSNL